MNAHSRSRPPAPAPRVELEPDVEKILSAIGFLIKEAERRRLPVTQYDIVKSLFIADRAHLNMFGRPITFDNYVAMKHGPVPSLAYDLLKINMPMLKKYGLSSLPWKRQEAEHIGRGCFRFFEATTPNEEETLSESEVESLSSALTIISGLSFGQVRELTHNDLAYKEAWNAVDDDSSNAMSLGLLFDTPDFAAAELIEFLSKQVASNKGDDGNDNGAIISSRESRSR